MGHHQTSWERNTEEERGDTKAIYMYIYIFTQKKYIYIYINQVKYIYIYLEEIKHVSQRTSSGVCAILGDVNSESHM